MEKHPTSLQEVQLIKAVTEGDKRAFSQLYNAYFRILVQQAYAMLNDEARAYDIVQDTFLDMWNRRKTLSITRSLSAYLHFAVRNAALNDIKRLKIHETKLDALARRMATDDTPADALVRHKQLQETFDHEVAKLPSRMREALLLSRQQGLSHSEIAKKMGVSKSTVKTQVNNALHVLRHKLSSFFQVLLLLNFI